MASTNKSNRRVDRVLELLLLLYFFYLHSIRAVDTSILNYALEYLVDVMEQQDNSQWTTAREHEKKMFIQKVRFIDHFIMWMNYKRHQTESSIETNNT